MKWGEQTNTDDTEGEVIATSPDRPTKDEIERLLPSYTGEISQTPPQYSAIKIKGERAYHKARKGDEFELPARKVQIDDLSLIELPDENTAVFKVHCGKGTYVRSLARDLGSDLGCYGHVTRLRRLFVKPFAARDMILLDTLEELGHKGADRSGLMACLVPILTALDDIPALPIDRDTANNLRQGRAVIMRGRDAPVNQDLVLAVHRTKPVAIATIEKGMLKPKRVFNLNQTSSQ